MKPNSQPTIGLALSGSGNRSTFYIGFLERLSEAGITIDYISAMSGGSLVASAYACGKLPEFKTLALKINKHTIHNYIQKSQGHGGLYSLQYFENFLRNMLGGLTFEEVKPKMAFVAVDIETGQQVTLCLGDIAKAVCISCTLPGIFEPVKWGDRTLVDGGLLNQIPLDVLKDWGADVMIAVNTRGTKHIFTENQINFKKVLNYFKKYLLIDTLTSWVGGLTKDDEIHDFTKKPGIFTVLGKSLDIAVQASSKENNMPQADLLIAPQMDISFPADFSEKSMQFYYDFGRKIAEENIVKINEIIKSKKKTTV